MGYLGQTATRDIYQNAVQELQDDAAAKLCLDFANMETFLQEIDRARTVLTYGAQMVDPRRDEEYWKTWNEFEISHGNEETFREMLRIKRSVEASFSTVNYNAAEMSGTDSKAEALSNEDAMKMMAERVAKLRKATTMTEQNKDDEDEIDIDELVDELEGNADNANDEDIENEARNIPSATANSIDQADKIQGISTKVVPAAVFGGLVKDN